MRSGAQCGRVQRERITHVGTARSAGIDGTDIRAARAVGCSSHHGSVHFDLHVVDRGAYGSRIVDGLLSDRLRSGWDGIARIGPILLVVLLVVPAVLGSRLLFGPIEFVRSLLKGLTGLVSG